MAQQDNDQPQISVLEHQIAYYRARAAEYDEWFYRQNRYDRGPEFNAQWAREVEGVRSALTAIGPVDSALELAPGTGIWTQELARMANTVVAVDASPEMIAINQAKVLSERVEYRQEDLFAWQPDREYDLVFFSFWLSHVPPSKLDGFLGRVAAATKPGGHVFIIDSQDDLRSKAKDHPGRDDEVMETRKLNDGSVYRIVKVYYEVDPLRQALDRAGFDAEVRLTDTFFIYASGLRR